ncbi:unnamed protein product [Heligmosomoides polygyrus]|uniref:Glutamate--cysteine ligase n=1 Tax=Heligmosomoides polygyrus TaxID=6339 RepID=A0A183F209_HELPZ|nr:unnamed protein product [Heligmosomoides polygyrus]
MDDVKAKIQEKKSLYHDFLDNKTSDNWQKATHYGDVYRMLESPDGEQYLLRPAIVKPRILKSSLASMMRALIF